jgi:multiple sugar transport system substrate-binding protein
MKLAFGIVTLLFVAMYIGALATMQGPPHDGKVHLKWATDDNPARLVQLATFSKYYPGIAAAVDPSGDGDSSKVLIQCATGVGPDLIDTERDSMNQMGDAGVLLDLTPYAKKMGFDPSHTFPSVRNALMYKGKQYRFPCNISVNCIIYNKKIFDDHNVPYPKPDWTEADFIRTCKELLNNPSKTDQKNLAYAPTSGYQIFEDSLVGRGGDLFGKDGLRSTIDSPQAIQAMTDYYDWMFVNKIIPTAADAASMTSQGGWGSGAINWFSSGKAAMLPIGRWYICQLYNYPELEGHLGAVLLPRLGGRPSAGVVDARGAGININSKHIPSDLKFLQYLASPEYSKINVDDGDSLPPDPNLAKSGKALVDSAVPDPAFHQPFVDAIKTGRPLTESPYIDSTLVSTWVGDYVQDVENQIMTPKQALQTLAAQINHTIQNNLARRPDLQKIYTEQTGKPYTPDWYKNYPG